MTITYNNGFGKMNAVEKDGILYVKRSAYLRAWQKVSDPKAGFGGGLAQVVFDTDMIVNDDYYPCRVYKSRAK